MAETLPAPAPEPEATPPFFERLKQTIEETEGYLAVENARGIYAFYLSDEALPETLELLQRAGYRDEAEWYKEFHGEDVPRKIREGSFPQDGYYWHFRNPDYGTKDPNRWMFRVAVKLVDLPPRET